MSVLTSWTVADRAARWRRVLSGDAPGPHHVEAAVFECDGSIVGFASRGEQPDEGFRAGGHAGEIRTIYLLRAAQGQGGGRALMARAAPRLMARGHRGVGLWVLRENLRARAFYERLGGIPCGEEDDWAGERVVDLGYGWPSLDALAEWPLQGVRPPY